MKKADKKLFTRLAKASARRQVLVSLANDRKKGDVTALPRLENSAFMKQSIYTCFRPAYHVIKQNWALQNKHEKADFKDLCLRSAASIEKTNYDLEAIIRDPRQ